MVDTATEENVQSARQAFDLPAPVYLCLGNHDMRPPDALRTWLAEAPGFFVNDRPSFSIARDDCVLHVMPTQWNATPYFWDKAMDPHFLAEQMETTRAAIEERPEAIHILCTHSPVMGVPTEQTGFPAAYHDPGEAFRQTVFDLVKSNPRALCVLSAHTHINSHVEENGVHFVTASAFVETPFEFKLIDVTPERMRLSTISLAALLDFAPRYDDSRRYVQGREQDRAFEVTL